jgi:GNAT superfamily N-acetyltransferase
MTNSFLLDCVRSGDQAKFLAGPYHSENDVVVEPLCAGWKISLSNTLDNLSLENDPKAISDHIADTILDHGAIEYMPLCDPVLIIKALSDDEVKFGLLAVIRDGADFRIIGSYVAAELAVDGPWQGQGIGSRLVLHRAQLDGELPTWTLDEVVYTEAGRAAHLRAFRMLQNELDLQHQAAGPDM